MEYTKYGKCRCCLAKGTHRDINKEYYYKGVKEVFTHDFKECFNINLSPDKSLTTLICSSCISKLRAACQFRNLAVNTERKLLESLPQTNKRHKHTVFINEEVTDCSLDLDCDLKTEVIEVKQEEPSDELFFDDFEPELDDKDDIDTIISSPHIENNRNDKLTKREKELLSRFEGDSLKRLPTRKTLRSVCPNYVRHLDLLKGIIVMPSMIEKLLKNNERRRAIINTDVFITEKIGQVVNATTLLQFSNLTPFKSRGRSGFLCFYCPYMFDDFSKLRDHTQTHNKDHIKNILKTYVTESLIINVDVNDLKCTICGQGMQNISELKTHLTRNHGKEIHARFTDRIIPFKLSADSVYECQFCASRYETFGAIERHMNKHYRNYICKECDAGFVTKLRLKVHITNTHGDGTYPCEICGKTFNTQLRHKSHVDSVHLMVKRFKCNKCPERFSEYIYRQRHLVEVHGVPQIEYKCNVCEKSFSRRYNLNIHVKKDHLKEREFQCETCPYKCFSSKQLAMHMVKHNGLRVFECSVCKKSYARKKTLKEHMKIHNNDKRFVCSRCDIAFVQKCSLKAHMKSHHYRVFKKTK